MTERAHTILIVDGHPLVRHALSRIISNESNLHVVGEAADYLLALQLVQRHKPDLAIIDLRLEGGSGLDLIKQIKHDSPDTKVLVYTANDGAVYAERSLKAGAEGYISKRDEIPDSIGAIHTVLNGDIALSGEINQQVLAAIAPGPRHESRTSNLTDRELRVLELIGNGYTTREIAAHLELSTKTIESHRERIKSKLQIRCAARLSRHAVEWVLTCH